VAAALGVAAALAGWWASERSRSELDRVEVEEALRVVALDRAGRVLWRRAGVNSKENFLPIRTTPGGGLRLAAILAVPPAAYESEERHRLALLDPRTGAIAEEVTLPSAAAHFAELGDRFTVRMRSIDLDADGIDEIFVSYNHQTSWPSYTVLYEPRQRRSRVVFVAADTITSAGSPTSTATVGSGPSSAPRTGRAGTPASVWCRFAWMDERRAGRSEESGPGPPRAARRSAPALVRPAAARLRRWAARGGVDPARRELTYAYQDGRRLALSFDGFVIDEPTGRGTPAARRANRAAAYAALRTARRLLGGGYAAEAMERLRQATSEAEAAADPRLREWSERVAISALVATGDLDEAEALAARISRESDSAPEIAFDTARALHLHGAATRRRVGISEAWSGQPLPAGRRAWSFSKGRRWPWPSGGAGPRSRSSLSGSSGRHPARPPCRASSSNGAASTGACRCTSSGSS
jgi:hypothetical protein